MWSYLFGGESSDDRARNPFAPSGQGGYNRIDNFESAPIFSFKRRVDGQVYPSTPIRNDVGNDISNALAGEVVFT